MSDWKEFANKPTLVIDAVQGSAVLKDMTPFEKEVARIIKEQNISESAAVRVALAMERFEKRKASRAANV